MRARTAGVFVLIRFHRRSEAREPALEVSLLRLEPGLEAVLGGRGAELLLERVELFEQRAPEAVHRDLDAGADGVPLGRGERGEAVQNRFDGRLRGRDAERGDFRP